MDPLSIAASCVALVSATVKTSVSVNSFIREVRDARADLDVISRELLSLRTVLELLAEDTSNPITPFPAPLQKQILGIVKNCNVVVCEIGGVLKRHEKSKLGRSGYWTVGGGKADMAKFRSNLEAHKSALEIALEMVAMYGLPF